MKLLVIGKAALSFIFSVVILSSCAESEQPTNILTPAAAPGVDMPREEMLIVQCADDADIYDQWVGEWRLIAVPNNRHRDPPILWHATHPHVHVFPFYTFHADGTFEVRHPEEETASANGVFAITDKFKFAMLFAMVPHEHARWHSSISNHGVWLKSENYLILRLPYDDLETAQRIFWVLEKIV